MIQIYDTTLRDGTQRENISLSCIDKLRIAHKLDELGVAFIEGGWPGSNPKDADFFRNARNETWKNALITSFGSTCHADRTPAEDANIQALLDSETPVCTLVGKSWMLHVTDVLRTTPENNLRVIEQSVAFLRSHGRRVIYDAEHFFDGYQDNPAYALETLKAAIRGGAETLVLCDTNGGTLPLKLTEIVQAVGAAVNHPLGIHAHNDSECAVANSLSAVKAGCVQVQGTINGYGERCGNANLCSVIPSLELKLDQRCLPEGNLPKLYALSRFVSEIVNLTPDEHLPYIGNAAFAHKGGIHVAAMRRNARTYQHINPEMVGNHMRVIVSELSGRGNLLSKAEEYGLHPSGEEVTGILNEIKQLESTGFSFEAAEASVVLMFKRQQDGYKAPFELIDFTAMVEHRQGRGIFAEATVKVKVGNEIFHTAAEGNGPVNALDAALRKALISHYPMINEFHLSDYKVRILNGNTGTAATTRVLIDTRRGEKIWSTVGAGSNIIEASWRALADSFEFGLMAA
ncbi:MAG: citramalate synthase [Anaerolineaceae bacterium]|nr:citramalate synthase [Anaerolineaceae bacterium]